MPQNPVQERPAVLTTKQRQFLKGRAHNLNPVVIVGMAGASPALRAELNLALEAHELVKVKLPALDKAERDALMAELTGGSGAELVQRIGRVLVLYRPSEKGLIALP